MSEPFRVSVKLFGSLRVACRQGDLMRHVRPGSTVAELWRELISEFPALAGPGETRLAAVNLDYCDENRVLSPDDEVAFFPPVSGG